MMGWLLMGALLSEDETNDDEMLLMGIRLARIEAKIDVLAAIEAQKMKRRLKKEGKYDK